MGKNKIKIKRIPTTENNCVKCLFNCKFNLECNDEFMEKCRRLKNGIDYYLVPVLPNGFESILTVLKNGSLFDAITIQGEIIKNVHYACDLSGEEQPPFEGFFVNEGSYNLSVSNIIGWKEIGGITPPE